MNLNIRIGAYQTVFSILYEGRYKTLFRSYNSLYQFTDQFRANKSNKKILFMSLSKVSAKKDMSTVFL